MRIKWLRRSAFAVVMSDATMADQRNLVSGDASNRIRKIALTPSSPSSPPFAKRSSAHCQSNRSPSNYSKNDKSD